MHHVMGDLRLGGRALRYSQFVPKPLRDGTGRVLEQNALFDAVAAQPSDNPDRIPFDQAITAMAEAPTIELPHL